MAPAAIGPCKGTFSASTSKVSSMASSMMASPLHLMIGVYLLVGLDDIGLLCMLAAYLGLQGQGLLDCFRARLEGSKAPKDKPCATPEMPHALLMGCVVLVAVLRLVGPSLQLAGAPVIADLSFFVLAGVAYCQLRMPAKTPQKPPSSTAYSTDKKLHGRVPRLAGRHKRQWPDAPSVRSSTPLARNRQTSAPLANGSPEDGGALGSRRQTAPHQPATRLADEIDRFVTNILPNAKDNLILDKLTKRAKKCIGKVVPEADITTVAYVNLQPRHTDGEVHDLDCHMVVTCDPEILAARLEEYFLQAEPGRRKNTDNLWGPDLRRCATKALSQRLNFVNFWRSQFSGLDPLVVYAVPDHVTGCRGRIRLHFMVNCPYHLRLAAVVSEGETRTKEVVVFIVEWAKRRALVNITRGHAHPYAWCLMALHFLRFKARESQSLVETLRGFMVYLNQCLSNDEGTSSSSSTSEGTSAKVDIMNNVSGLPSIEDPCDSSTNAAGTLTADGVARVREELVRAEGILAKEHASVSELLERYVGPVAPPSEGS